MFTLHPQLERDSFFVASLELSQLLLINNALFPWLVLVPRAPEARELIDLQDGARHQLMDEISLVSRCMQSLFAPDKLNIAALGNQVPQLHIHVIARFAKDAAWPHPVWGKGNEPYTDPKPFIDRLKKEFKAS